ARAYWPNRDAIGQCLHFDKADALCTRVIGVVKDSHLDHIIEQPTAELFAPTVQRHATPTYVVVRAAPGQVARVAATLRAALRTAFPGAEPPYVRTVAATLEPQLRPWILGESLFGV